MAPVASTSDSHHPASCQIFIPPFALPQPRSALGLLESPCAMEHDADKRRRLADLLPAPARTPLTAVTAVSSATRLPRARKRSVPAACEACRLRKSKALKRKYDETKDRNEVLEELFQFLQSKPEKEAFELFRRIRAKDDAESIVKHVKDGNLVLQLALTPESRFRYQFPHVKEMPRFLQTPDNPYVDSMVYEWTVGALSTSQQSSQSQSRRASGNETENQSPYLKPFHAAVLVDPLLDSVKPSTWTSVSTDDDLMRDLLAAYFLSEHMFFPHINKNLFLEDMASRSTRFCSSLLVNSVLAVACHCSRRIQGRADYWNPQSLGYKFLAEAKRLWDLEGQQSKLTTIQAALFLNRTCNMDGADTIGRWYTSRAVDMARELELFTVPNKAMSQEMRIAREFTAWTLFCWQGFVSYVLFRPPLIAAPPEFPLPDPTLCPQWYGDFWIKYPLDRMPTTAHYGHDFKARAELMAIMNEIAVEYFSGIQPREGRSMKTILKFYAKLKAWHDALPEPLTVKRIVLPSQLKLHMTYHNLVINLFKPLADNELEALDLGTFVKEVQQTPKQVVMSATVRLETLFRIYYLRHGFEAMDVFLLHFLNTLGFMALEELKTNKDPSMINDRRCLLLMCALGLREQGQYYYLVRTIFHLFRSSMSPDDVSLLKLYAQDQNPEKDELHRPQDIVSEYPLNITAILDDPQAHRVTHLVETTKLTG
ncbi:Zn(2)-C6 fungal-type DNA-binding domain [Fusarium albosuccineum]|uniref:Zn(2)-C6 fungal-type DNA-binding domain n=1 Tax=Fusarium albosuccineum TaxID=1237068 RepID=A0A8H4L147_9HYPO|nr:Zn(2)-C6 fungal-type DNA-binding domain [Fusarium albosuccineum]